MNLCNEPAICYLTQHFHHFKDITARTMNKKVSNSERNPERTHLNLQVKQVEPRRRRHRVSPEESMGEARRPHGPQTRQGREEAARQATSRRSGKAERNGKQRKEHHGPRCSERTACMSVRTRRMSAKQIMLHLARRKRRAALVHGVRTTTCLQCRRMRTSRD